MKTLLLFWCFLAMQSFLKAQTTREENELNILLDTYRAAMLNSDSLLKSQLFTDDYLEVSANKTLLTKKQAINYRGVKLISLNITDKKFSIVDNNAYVITRIYYEANTIRSRVCNSQLSSFSCRKINGNWQISGSHHSEDKRNLSYFSMKQASSQIINQPWKLQMADKEKDGMQPSLSDGKALYFCYDDKTDTLWFRLDLYTPVNIINAAMSISFDTDTNQENGVNWYGSNRSFKVDKMLSVGLLFQADSNYYGYNGITDETGIRTANWLNEKRGNISVYYYKESNSFFIGAYRKDISDTPAISFIGSVGNNAVWNDDIGPDGAFSTIKFSKQ